MTASIPNLPDLRLEKRWNEEDHPRGEGGKFTDGGGGGSSSGGTQAKMLKLMKSGMDKDAAYEAMHQEINGNKALSHGEKNNAKAELLDVYHKTDSNAAEEDSSKSAGPAVNPKLAKIAKESLGVDLSQDKDIHVPSGMTRIALKKAYEAGGGGKADTYDMHAIAQEHMGVDILNAGYKQPTTTGKLAAGLSAAHAYGEKVAAAKAGGARIPLAMVHFEEHHGEATKLADRIEKKLDEEVKEAGSVHYGHVGSRVDTVKDLKDIHDSMHNEGEYDNSHQSPTADKAIAAEPVHKITGKAKNSGATQSYLSETAKAKALVKGISAKLKEMGKKKNSAGFDDSGSAQHYKHALQQISDRLHGEGEYRAGLDRPEGGSRMPRKLTTVADDLARVRSGMTPEAAAAFTAAHEKATAEKVGERDALRRALAAVGDLQKRAEMAPEDKLKIHKVQGTIVGNIDQDGDVDYACASCMALQPECACHACGEIGPGVHCISCGAMIMPGACPRCGVLWNPVLVEEAEEETRAVDVEILETRASGDVGELVGWANSELLDQHGTVILPTPVLLKAMEGRTQMDVEHDEKAVPGVTFHDFHVAKRHVTDPETGRQRLVEGVSFIARCNLLVAEARAVYEKYKAGLLKGFSIGFTMARSLKAQIVAGVTRTIDTITSLPFISAVANPSNTAATLLEMRSAKLAAALTRETEEPPPPADPAPAEQRAASTDPASTIPQSPAKAAEQSAAPAADTTPQQAQQIKSTETLDVLGTVRSLLDDASKAAQEATADPGPSADSPPQATGTDQAVAPPAATEPSVIETRVAETIARLDLLSTQVQEMRATPQARDWEPGITSLESAIGECRASLVDLTTRTTKAEGQMDTMLGILRDITPWVRQMIEQRVATLKAPQPRIGTPGDLVETRIAAEVRGAAEKKKEGSELEKRIESMRMLMPPR